MYELMLQILPISFKVLLHAQLPDVAVVRLLLPHEAHQDTRARPLKGTAWITVTDIG